MPRVKYPRDWEPTGHGSFREIRPGEFELRFRDERGERDLILPCTADEAREFIAVRTRNRRRLMAGMPVSTTWHDAISLYEKKMLSNGNKEKYVSEVTGLLKQIRDTSGVEPPELRAIHIDIWIQGLAAQARKGLRDAVTKPRPEKQETRNLAGVGRTCNKKRAMVHAFFKWLEDLELVDRNPVRAVKAMKHTPREGRNLAKDDFFTVWAICEPELQDLLLFLLYTGCRIGEAAAMKNEDFIDGIWKIPNRKWGIKLVMDLPGKLVEIVLRQKKSTDGRVWSRWNSPQPEKAKGFHLGSAIDDNWFAKCLRRRCEKAGVKPFTAHALRSAFATWLEEEDVNLRTIQKALGHTKIETTMLYAKSKSMKLVRAAQQKLIDLCTNACADAVKKRYGDDENGPAKQA